MFVGMKVGDVQEPKPVASGRYPLIITEAKVNPPKSADKGPNIEVSIGIEGHIDAPNVRHFMALQKADDEPKKAAFKQLMVKRFLVQFGVPYTDDGFNVEDFAGHRADGQLDLSEPDEKGNIYNRLQVDRLPSEPAEK